MNIVIADINFLISCKEMPVVSANREGTYASFISGAASAGSASVSIDVGLELKAFPSTALSTHLFEAPDAWSLFRQGDEYFWSDTPASRGGEPTCLARFNRKTEKITIYCGEQLITGSDGQKALMNPISYPLDQILTMYTLANRKGALMHSSAVEFNGKAYMFMGKSGAGKSTISRSFAARGYNLLSDDRIVVRKIDGTFYTFGTPWAGDAEIAENRKLQLGGILFIRQSADDRIEKITPPEAVERLMPVTSIPWFDEQAMSSILSFCEDLVLHVPAHDIFFKPGIGVVELFEQFKYE